ncbi:hypothetical protein ASPZODRAFT_75008 [Penicilliopsis zonata CBS 506.65]|uniref:Zn(2)-C6 fungal-type domain-containing protein n=1 Tax=Penicilliopsis zonata CBS 506.65 TaxID=1073090 RepID=A0A1L9S7A5_9EURO|nr:hypothetical protein ASPZODRAFT_75008 [Penicilliopsis zonata CBS 506.65]OJJ43055.1 hypothetical protein ASPZODRAFT_75008 [Penicilliopsis zonata CBS 506.65]
METIKIPSPSAILDPPDPPASRLLPPSSPNKKAASTNSNRLKQSKSRNGMMPPPKNEGRGERNGGSCITCKAKRLKCDETKPTCLHCKKRNVPCGGYKKDFKWRPFEEGNMAAKATAPTKIKKVPSPLSPVSVKAKAAVPPRLVKRSTTQKADGDAITAQPSHSLMTSPLGILGLNDEMGTGSSLIESATVCLGDRMALNINEPQAFYSPPEDTPLTDQSSWLSDFTPPPPAAAAAAAADILIPVDVSQGVFGFSPKSDTFSFSDLLEGDGDEVEDIIRQADSSYDPWFPHIFEKKQPKPPSNYFSDLLREPELEPSSPEMLIMRFDRLTCGILSVKDGETENPWRTLIWPLAKDTPALCHAIYALAAFHSSKEEPALRVHGVDHMRQSIACMVQGIQNMRTDAALATSLALAFADTWDTHTRTCIQHLRGAKALVSQALQCGIRTGLRGDDLERVQFLYNTWLYMDVIARLTALDGGGGGDQSEMDLSVALQQATPGDDNRVHEIDPLMGSASTLFPLIYRVTKLIQRVRQSESNSLALVSQAIELKAQLERWDPPARFEPPEDPTSEVQHSLQTAHAYRWATLLYLHQAVPEIPSEPAADLAKRVLLLLATVPASSRTTIIHMFPLLAAGCEAEQAEDRRWVIDRWTTIQSRLMLGGVDRCLDVTMEVWARRDACREEEEEEEEEKEAEEAMSRTSSVYPRATGSRRRRRASADNREKRSTALSPLENIEFTRTVRGHLHWVKVMEEWGWEGISPPFFFSSFLSLSLSLTSNSVFRMKVKSVTPVQIRFASSQPSAWLDMVPPAPTRIQRPPDLRTRTRSRVFPPRLLRRRWIGTFSSGEIGPQRGEVWFQVVGDGYSGHCCVGHCVVVVSFFTALNRVLFF